MIGVLLLLAACGWWLWRDWRKAHPVVLRGCPMCAEQLRHVDAHLMTVHAADPWYCRRCVRMVPAEHKGAHWRLFHTARPLGPEDKPDWSVR